MSPHHLLLMDDDFSGARLIVSCSEKLRCKARERVNATTPAREDSVRTTEKSQSYSTCGESTVGTLTIRDDKEV